MAPNAPGNPPFMPSILHPSRDTQIHTVTRISRPPQLRSTLTPRNRGTTARRKVSRTTNIKRLKKYIFAFLLQNSSDTCDCEDYSTACRRLFPLY
ncbi:hypothetical protein evm_014986 [Chilo suppressalis]|nr:hypothetical protein evm_014986 [Chilo suppressalis]